MPAQPIYPYVDRALGGKLAELLIGWRAQDPPLSPFQIAVKLHDEHEVDVSPDTVARWLKQEQVA